VCEHARVNAESKRDSAGAGHEDLDRVFVTPTSSTTFLSDDDFAA
jgi:hypothetical protein